ncbi:MAG: FtsQ-type POTRA domain-containing protein [Bacilli bacterium]|jgi:cell division protein FtsQ|nr:FtsQ-type POTRA domain-containing protein [Bacilli bacterium]
MAKIKKKKRLKLIPFLLFVLVITGAFFLVDVLLDTRIENIVIKGNKLVTDQQIIDEAGLSNYPSFYKTTSYNIKKALEKNSFIKEVKVKRSFYHVITIEVSEYKVLLKKETTGKLVLENMNEVTTDQEIPYTVPRLVNDVPKNKYSKLLKNLLKVKRSVRSNISEFYYDPNEFDKDRFLLYMDDGNSVYLTLTKFRMINYYNDVLPQLDGKKGILYLDSGNHFQIMES